MMQKEVLLLVSSAVVFTVLVSCGGCDISISSDPDVEYTEQLNWRLDSAGVSVIDVQTINGLISFNGSDQGQVIVHAQKEVRAHDEERAEEFARKVQVHVERNGNTMRIYKEHPNPGNIQVAVRYEIQSPSTVDVKFRTSNGKIEINRVDGVVDAETSNGAIDLQGGTGNVNLRTSNGKIELRGATGRIHARTSNGSIVAALGMLRREAIFSTSNGSIDVTLPADFSGQLDAETSNGGVTSDFPILIRATGEISKNRLVGQIGEGGEAIVKLRTSNGSIRLSAQQ